MSKASSSSGSSGAREITDVEDRAPQPVPRAAESGDCVKAVSIGLVVESLYENFNKCNADGTADCFTEDVIYEDLLLGNSTIVESREDFRELIQTHPVFVGRQFCLALRLPAPDIAVKVDGISEDVLRSTVGVQWHVEVGGAPLALSRGISFMRICRKTGLIKHAVDIAEAPWRTVGLLVAPIVQSLRALSRPPFQVTGTALLAVGTVVLIFLDKSLMDGLRAAVDYVDDFRSGLSLGTPLTMQDFWAIAMDVAELSSPLEVAFLG